MEKIEQTNKYKLHRTEKKIKNLRISLLKVLVVKENLGWVNREKGS
jgi:hypothetical protein